MECHGCSEVDLCTACFNEKRKPGVRHEVGIPAKSENHLNSPVSRALDRILNSHTSSLLKQCVEHTDPNEITETLPRCGSKNADEPNMLHQARTDRSRGGL